MYVKRSNAKYATKTVIATFISTVVLAACGGSGGGDSLPPDSSLIPTQLRSATTVESTSLTAVIPPLADSSDKTFSWTQTGGPELTDLADTNTRTITFTAPASFETLRFEFRVTNNGQVLLTEYVVVVTETGTPVFIDSSFDGISKGSITAPYRTFSEAFAASEDTDDFYVKQVPGFDYDIPSITLGSGQSLYGAFQGDDWERDIDTIRTDIIGSVSSGNEILHENVDDLTTISGFNMIGVSLVALEGSGEYSVANNSLQLLNALDSVPDSDTAITPPESAVGIFSSVDNNTIVDNIIDVGNGGNAIAQLARTGRGAAGGDGRTGGTSGGGDGGSGCNGGCWNGGDGGNGATTGDSPTGSSGSRGSGGDLAEGGPGGEGRSRSSSGTRGVNGESAPPRESAAGGVNVGGETFENGIFKPSGNGANGSNGYSGGGGGGGGGGGSGNFEFNFDPKNGGGGGGGGEGGGGGLGGVGGFASGSSIGIALDGGEGTVLVSGNTIKTGNGGVGGEGAAGQLGGVGGDGGRGGAHEPRAAGSPYVPGSDGGDGGTGGTGGQGGTGGSGAGGNSFGIFVGVDVNAAIEGNTITTGNGGTGGSADSTSSNGGGGWSFGIYDADPEDGVVPSLNDNTVTPGVAGTSNVVAGEAGISNF